MLAQAERGSLHQLAATKSAAVTEANEYTAENAVLKTDVVSVDNVAEDATAASDAKVVSEKLLFDALEWKTEM